MTLIVIVIVSIFVVGYYRCVDGYRNDYRHHRLRYHSVDLEWADNRLLHLLLKDVLDALCFQNCLGPDDGGIVVGVNLYGDEDSCRRRHHPVQRR